MFGFSIIYNNSLDFLLDGYKHINYTTIKSKQIISFSFTFFERFSADKIFKQNEDYVVCIDGVILNLKSLKNRYGNSDYFNLIADLWNRKKHFFPNELKGEFSGFIFDKKSEELFVFCNQTATKPMYYSSCDNSIIVSNNISQIIAYRDNLKISNTLNKNGVYSMFTYGAMIENETLVEEVVRLHAGQYISNFENKITVNSYQNFNDVPYSIFKKEKAINLLEESFGIALELEYQKDLEYGYNHFATLSGGLDSRMNVMLANNSGYKNDVFCFSESGYLDEEISRNIANYLDLDYDFFALDGGEYFKDIEENVKIGRGTAFYIGAAHLNFSLSKIENKNYGLLHTGLIGDAILGGFISNKKAGFTLKTTSSRFIDKVDKTALSNNKFSSEETLKLKNRIFNMINIGAYTVESHETYLVSPFMDVDFINSCLSIDPELKKNGKLYLEWINKYHPEMTRFAWERTGFKPTHLWKTELSRYTNKLKLEYYRMLKKENRLSMNPIEFWYRNNAEVRLVYETFFDEKMKLIGDLELRKDFKEMFDGNVFEKAMVITVLEFINFNNIKV